MIAATPGRPRVWLNCAASADGRLAHAFGRPAALSGPEDLKRVHTLRAASDAILVGIGTVLSDDPSLRVRWELVGTPEGAPPRRVILDSHGRTPAGARVLDGTLPTFVATGSGVSRTWPPGVTSEGFGIGRVDLNLLLPRLRDLGVRNLMVEGGATVLASFVRAGLFDRWTIYYAPVAIGGTAAPVVMAGPDPVGPDGLSRLRRTESAPLGEGTLVTYVPG